MISDKKIVIFLSLFFLLVSTLVYRSDICCMFSATRYYGWPSSFIVVNKTTEFLDEAKKVETKNLVSLMKDGWKISFGANQMGQYGISPIVIVNLISNYLFYLLISYLLVKVFGFKQK